MGELQMWRGWACEDVAIAATAAEARQMVVTQFGVDQNDTHAVDPVEDWRAMPMDKVFTFIEDDGSEIRHTAREWINLKGPGYFASSNI